MKTKRTLNHNIIIIPSDNGGFTVKIGTGNFVFSGNTDLLKGLSEYVNSPEEVDGKYCKSFFGLHIDPVTLDKIPGEDLVKSDIKRRLDRLDNDKRI